MLATCSRRPRNKKARRIIAGPSLWTDGPLGRSVAERVELPVQAGARDAEACLVADREGVAGGHAAGPGVARGDAVAAEIDVEILALERDVRGESVFDTAANRVAGPGVGAGAPIRGVEGPERRGDKRVVSRGVRL